MDRLNDNLNGEEMLKLHSYFPKDTEESFSLGSLDGFFYGLYCLPRLVMPSEWLTDILPVGLEGSKKNIEQALNLILRYYNQVGSYLHDEEVEPNFDGSFAGASEWLEGFCMAFSYDTRALEKLAAEEAKRSKDKDTAFLASLILSFGMDIEHAPENEDRDSFLKLKAGILAMIEKGSQEQRSSLLADIAQTAYELLEPIRKKSLKAMPKPSTFLNQEPKMGRNDPCHCGSGKKFKHCHGKN